jgi:hypothetical protein
LAIPHDNNPNIAVLLSRSLKLRKELGLIKCDQYPHYSSPKHIHTVHVILLFENNDSKVRKKFIRERQSI